MFASPAFRDERAAELPQSTYFQNAVFVLEDSLVAGTVSQSVLDHLAKYDSPTICNIIELCDYRARNTGFMNHRIKSLFPNLPSMVGYATTATFRSATASPPDEPKGLAADQMKRILEIPGPRVMVIQDLDEPFGAAVFGEVMATSYRAFGCVGMVTNGYGRDINQVRPLKFPCFASGICVSHGYSRLIEFNVPVDIGGVRIQPGDLIHGDADGITTIPIEIAESVASAGDAFMEAEEIIIGTAKDHPEDVAAYQKALDAAHAKMRDIAAGIKHQGQASKGEQLA